MTQLASKYHERSRPAIEVPGTPAIAARDQPAWQAWLAEQFGRSGGR